MIRFVADENSIFDVIAGVLRRNPDADFILLGEVGLLGAVDSVILEFAARNDRVVLTHDLSTMSDFAYERIGAGLPMPGVVVVPQELSIGQIVREVLLMVEESEEGEWEDVVLRLPL